MTDGERTAIRVGHVIVAPTILGTVSLDRYRLEHLAQDLSVDAIKDLIFDAPVDWADPRSALDIELTVTARIANGTNDDRSRGI